MPQESVKYFIERFRNLSLLCPTGMPISMLLQTCRHNLLNRVESRIGAVKAHTWKDMVEHAEQAEMSANRYDPPTPKQKWVPDNNKNRDTAWPFQSKGKNTMAVEVIEEVQPAPRK